MKPFPIFIPLVLLFLSPIQISAQAPIGVATPGSQTVCTNVAITYIALSTSNGMDVGTTYAWTRDNTINVTGLANSGTGDISGTPVNGTTSPQLVTYSITPTNGGFDGDVFNATVTVTPSGDVNDPPDQVVCNTDNTAPIYFSTVLSGGVTHYTWTNDTPAIGLAASGSGNIPSFAAINSGTAPVIATITVTPHFTYDGLTCDGPPETFTITVNPTAQVDDPADQVVCNTDLTTVTFTTTTSGGTPTYTWVNDTPGIGLAASGSGDISFNAVNIGTAPVVATIVVTPHFTLDGHTCDGPTQEFTITVNPTAQVNDPVDQVLCNTEITGPVTFTTDRTLGTTTYTWTNDAPGIGLAASGTGDIPAFAAINNGSAPVIATIAITPHFTYAGLTCDGPVVEFTITVNPTAQVVDPADLVVCNSDVASVNFITANSGGTVTYTWVNDTPGIGLAASGSGDILFIALNAGTSPVTATITVTPSFNNGSVDCTGPTQQFTITVNPTAQVNDHFNQVVCNTDNSIAVNFTTTNSGAETTYSWTNDTPSIGLAASGDGNIPPFSTINMGTAPVTATLTVTPQISSLGGPCYGPSENFTITVNPTAQVNDPVDQVVQNGEITAVYFSTGLTGGSISYTWLNNSPWIGLAASGSGIIAPFTAINTLSEPVVARITVTPHFSNGGVTCDGPAEIFTITVNPGAPIANAGLDQEICGSLNAILEGNDPIAGNGLWTQVSGPGTVLFGDETAYNTSASASAYGTYVLRWAISYDGNTTSDEVLVTVNPKPDADAGPDQVVCFGESVTLTAAGGIFYNWDNGVTNGIPFTPITSNEYNVIVIDGKGCSDQDQVLVEVKPKPQAPTITFDSDTLFSDSDLGNQWYVDGILIADADDAFYIPTVTGTYYTIVTVDGCDSEKSNNIFVQITGIKQNENNALKIYPNPTEDLITIETKDIGRYALMITASNGQILLQEVVTDPIYTIDLSGILNGVYFITIRSKDFVSTKKIVKW